MKFSGKYHKNPIVKAISYPGILMQHITTKEPDKKQLEIAINSMKLVLDKENKRTKAKPKPKKKVKSKK
jgi:uncharacterized protein YqhQ